MAFIHLEVLEPSVVVMNSFFKWSVWVGTSRQSLRINHQLYWSGNDISSLHAALYQCGNLVQIKLINSSDKI